MPGKVIGKYLNKGYPGTVSRSPDTIITSFPCGEDDIKFGMPVVLDDGKLVPFTDGHTADDFLGIAVRVAKQELSQQEDTCYHEGEAVDVLTRGNISVTIKDGTPVTRHSVFVRPSDSAFLAEDDGDSVELDGVVFSVSNLDARKVGEVAVLTRRV